MPPGAAGDGGIKARPAGTALRVSEQRGRDGRQGRARGGGEHGQGVIQATFPLGSIAGIRIGVNWSVVVIFALIAFGLADQRFPAANPFLSPLTYAVAGVVTALVFIGSLLAHELAHSVVARRNGLAVEGITLWLFGGVSRLQGEVPDPAAEVRIAGAGPLTSLVLAGIFFAAGLLYAAAGRDVLAGVPGVIDTALVYLGVINVALFAFNAIPAAPLDGGRLLRAFIWWVTRDKVKATVWASLAGQVFGWILIAGGLFSFFVTGVWGGLWIAVVGWFLIGAARAEARQAVVSDQLRGVRVWQIMTPDPVTAPGSMLVGDFLEDCLFRSRHQTFPVTGDGGEVTGLVTFNRIKRVAREERARARLGDVACPLSDVATAAPDEPVADLLPRLTSCADGRALVFDGGRLAGIVSPSDITRTLERLGIGRSGPGPRIPLGRE
jgi:Zn-dependent protease/CBS domain-containing protein